jgi:hypothetical protein
VHIQTFHAEVSKTIRDSAAALCVWFDVVTQDVLDFIAQANSLQGNLPAITVGRDQFTTAHQAAGFVLLNHLIAVVEGVVGVLGDPSGLDFIKDSLAPFDDPSAARRLGDGLLRISGDTDALWKEAFCASRSVAYDNTLFTKIERESAHAIAQQLRGPAAIGYSRPFSPKELATRYGRSAKTIAKWLEEGSIPARKIDTKNYMIRVDYLPVTPSMK